LLSFEKDVKGAIGMDTLNVQGLFSLNQSKGHIKAVRHFDCSFLLLAIVVFLSHLGHNYVIYPPI